MSTCNDDSDDDASHDECNDDMGETDEYRNFIPICCTPPSDNNTPPSKSFATLKEALQYDVQHAKFDLVAALAHILPASKNDVSDDVSESDEEEDIADEDDLINDAQFHTTLRFLNYAREHVRIHSAEYADAPAEFLQNPRVEQMFTSAMEFSEKESDDLYLSPTLENDAFLMSVEDLVTAALHVQPYLEETIEAEEVVGGVADGEGDAGLKEQIALLHSQLRTAKTCIARLTNSTESETNTAATNLVNKLHAIDNDTYYFDSYSTFHIHEIMLRDAVRTQSYASAIGAMDMRNKVVLDVGCGTGILSLLCVKQGAKLVVGVDNSEPMILAAKAVARENGIAVVSEPGVNISSSSASGHSGELMYVCGKIENLLPQLASQNIFPDIIISEWMGYALLYESMLPSVLSARDNPAFANHNNLKAKPKMMPSRSVLFLEGASDDRLSFWNDVYGFQMSTLQHSLALEYASDAVVETVPSTAIVTDRVALLDMDLDTIQDVDLDLTTIPFVLTSCGGEGVKVRLDKLVVSFDIGFESGDPKVEFSTGCQSTTTHWKQTTLWLDPMGTIAKTNGMKTTDNNDTVDHHLSIETNKSEFQGRFTMKRNRLNPREMDFEILWEIVDVTNTEHNKRVLCDGCIRSKLGS